MRGAIGEILRRPLQGLGGLLVPVQLFCLVYPERLRILDRMGLDFVLGMWDLRRHLGKKDQLVVVKACVLVEHDVRGHLSTEGDTEKER